MPDYRSSSSFCMENRAPEMVKGRKYRVVTGWGEEIMTFRGIMEENGNPLFVKNVFPIQQIPWGAIEELELLE
jgi:hypothetical protein